jgi:hypothetical protein
MTGRKSFERGMREIHGDVEVIELDAVEIEPKIRPAGARYRVMQTKVDPFARWPWWMRIGVAVPGIIACTAILIACAAVLGLCGLALWIIGASFFH